MSKRSKQEEHPSESKRARINLDAHAENCTDSTCQGCDVGEIEISFVRKDADGNSITTDPTASELLSMAIDESSNPQTDNPIARNLFDLALEKFQTAEPDNKIGYATCLVELGRAIQVEESLKEGLDVLRGEFKKDAKNVEVLFKLSGAAIALATFSRKQSIVHFEKAEQELMSADGEVEDEVALEELKKKQQLSKDEIKLYEEALTHAKEAINDHIDELQLAKEAQTLLHELRTYGQLLTQPFHKQHAEAVLNTVIELIKRIPKHQEDDELLNVWAACLLHQETFLEDQKMKKEILEKADELLQKSNKLHVKKHQKENPWVLEMVAMLRINQSNMAEDEDQALGLYDEAIQAFKKASELSPDNAKLAEMVNMLQAYQEAEEGQDYEEDDEEDDEEDIEEDDEEDIEEDDGEDLEEDDGEESESEDEE